MSTYEAHAGRARAPHRARRTPRTQRDIERAARRCRELVASRALLSAGATLVPIPGFDLAIDAGLLRKLLHEINAEFGLTPAQIAALAPAQRITVYRAAEALGATAVGRFVTRRLVALLVRRLARGIAARTVLRFVPLAGQALAASMSYLALKYLGERHVDDCVRVALSLRHGDSGAAGHAARSAPRGAGADGEATDRARTRSAPPRPAPSRRTRARRSA